MPNSNTEITVLLMNLQKPFVVFEEFLHQIKNIRPVGIGGDDHTISLNFPRKFVEQVAVALAAVQKRAPELEEPAMHVHCDPITGPCFRAKAVPQ